MVTVLMLRSVMLNTLKNISVKFVLKKIQSFKLYINLSTKTRRDLQLALNTLSRKKKSPKVLMKSIEKNITIVSPTQSPKALKKKRAETRREKEANLVLTSIVMKIAIKITNGNTETTATKSITIETKIGKTKKSQCEIKKNIERISMI